MVSKGDLGIGYLVGTGIALAGVLAIRVVAFYRPPDVIVLVGSLTGGVLSLAIAYAGYWLWRSDLSDPQIFTVSEWGAVGLASLTVLSVPALVRLGQGMYLKGNIVINNLAAGGVTGVLFGLVIVLRREHEHASKLNRRNQVLNRVLRHSIRNDMNVILGYVTILEQELRGTSEEMVELIGRRANQVVQLGETARRLETLAEREATETIDLTTLVEQRLEAISETYPYAAIDTDLPETAPVFADDLLGSALDTLLENAIQHSNNPEPAISVTVSPVDDGWVELTVRDDGPGIPDEVLKALAQGSDTHPDHLDGLGLQMAKWITESYGGELRFEETEGGGTTGTVRLRSAKSGTEGPVESVLPSVEP